MSSVHFKEIRGGITKLDLIPVNVIALKKISVRPNVGKLTLILNI